MNSRGGHALVNLDGSTNYKGINSFTNAASILFGGISKSAFRSTLKATPTLKTVQLTPTHYINKSKSEMQSLLNNVNKTGVKEPIKYIEYNGTKYIVDGQHRYYSALRSGRMEVPVEQVYLPYGSYKSPMDFMMDGKMPGYWKYMKPQ